STLQRALFLYIVFPILYFTLQHRRDIASRTYAIVAGSLLLLYFLIVLAAGGSDNLSAASTATVGQNYFEASYAPANAIEIFVWRSTAVPVFTASDSLRVFHEYLGGEPFWGATSLFFSTVFDLQRVPFERLVFEYQWGWNDLA